VSVEEVSVNKLQSLIDEIGESAAKIPSGEIKEELLRFRGRVEDMKIARIEIGHLNDLHSRGELTPDVYLIRHKQLTRDFHKAKDDIANKAAPTISELANDEEKRGKLSKLAESIKNNKDFVLAASQFLVGVVSVFAGKPS
jgi:hypothetical protein